MSIRRLTGFAIVLALLTGCMRNGSDRDATAADIARSGGLEPAIAQGASFDLQLYRRNGERPGPLVVYIEGDGAAYLDPRTPSADPTPIDPFALHLAATGHDPAVLYVGRPCQFAPGRADRRCTMLDWTTHRFSRDIVAAIDDAIDRELARGQRSGLVLVGYSGGGVIAALVAAQRSDVTLLITVAAPLDVEAWTQRMDISPLDGSDSPARHAVALAAIPQVHFAGSADRTVPVEVIQSFIEKLGPTAPARLTVVPGFDHVCCWLRDWPQLRADASR